MRLLLVNPPIYDFTAFDFWLRPYGMLRVAGQILSRGIRGSSPKSEIGRRSRSFMDNPG
jgi:hypothetical protein